MIFFNFWLISKRLGEIAMFRTIFHQLHFIWNSKDIKMRKGLKSDQVRTECRQISTLYLLVPSLMHASSNPYIIRNDFFDWFDPSELERCAKTNIKTRVRVGFKSQSRVENTTHVPNTLLTWYFNQNKTMRARMRVREDINQASPSDIFTIAND